MFLGVVIGPGLGLVVDDEIDIALAPQVHVLGAMPGHVGKAHHLEHGFQRAALRGGVLYELEAVQAHRIVKEICH